MGKREKSESSELVGQARLLLVASVLALLLGPVVILMGAFTANVLLMGSVLLIMGGLGLYAGMRHLNRT